MDGDGWRIGDCEGVGRGGALDDHAVGADLYLASLRGEGEGWMACASGDGLIGAVRLNLNRRTL